MKGIKPEHIRQFEREQKRIQGRGGNQRERHVPGQPQHAAEHRPARKDSRELAQLSLDRGHRR